MQYKDAEQSDYDRKAGNHGVKLEHIQSIGKTKRQ